MSVKTPIAYTAGSGEDVARASRLDLTDTLTTSNNNKENLVRKLELDDFSATATANMTVLPSAEATAWTAAASGGTEGGYCTVSGGIMTLDTTGVSAGTMQYYRAPGVNFANGLTFELKWKAETISGVCNIAAVRDNTNGKYVSLYSNNALNKWGISDGTGYFYFTKDMSNYRVWRLVMTSATAYTLIIDDEIIHTGTTSAAAVADYVGFGDLTNTAGVNVKMKYDYVSYAVSTKVNTFTKFSATADRIQAGGYNVPSMSVELDTANAAGALGIDTGSFTTATWYAVWLLFGSSGTTAVFSLSSTFAGVTAPAGYATCGRLIAWVYTDGTTATNLRYCTWDGDKVRNQYNLVVLNTTSPATTYTEVDFTPYLPPGILSGDGQCYIGVTSATYVNAQLSLGDANPYMQVYFQEPHASSNKEVITFAKILCNSERKLFYLMPSGSSRFNIGISGYEHDF